MEEKLTRAEWGAQSSAARERIEHTCAQCGAVFVAIRTALYCSRSCQLAVHHAKHRAEINRKRRERYQREHPTAQPRSPGAEQK